MTLIDPATAQRTSEYAQAFRNSQPFPHVAIDGFFLQATCERLLADFPAFEARHALNERGEIGGKAVRMDVREISDAYRELDRYLQTREFLDFVSEVTGIPDLLYDPDYVGGGTHENRHGQSLAAHVDFNFHPRTRWHRRLNLIVYLNPEWRQEWGGALELHSDPWHPSEDRVSAILPSFNRAVIFETSEVSWHGFSEIHLPSNRADLSRKSFAIYLYTLERPPETIAPSHATIYVPDALPSDWQAGRTLTTHDIVELDNRFTHMRTQLHYLYDREQQFGVQIEGLEHALGETRAAQRLELQGYATQPESVRGVWPDGWAGPDVAACIVPTRPTRSLRLELWTPPQLEAQQLQITLGATAHACTLVPGEPVLLELPLEAGIGERIGLNIRALYAWTPSADGESADQRALAYRIIGASLEHVPRPESEQASENPATPLDAVDP